jgi:hypothetical protein
MIKLIERALHNQILILDMLRELLSRTESPPRGKTFRANTAIYATKELLKRPDKKPLERAFDGIKDLVMAGYYHSVYELYTSYIVSDLKVSDWRGYFPTSLAAFQFWRDQYAHNDYAVGAIIQIQINPKTYEMTRQIILKTLNNNPHLPPVPEYPGWGIA